MLKFILQALFQSAQLLFEEREGSGAGCGSEHADPDPQHCSMALYYFSSTRLINHLNFLCIFIPLEKGWNDHEHFLAVKHLWWSNQAVKRGRWSFTVTVLMKLSKSVLYKRLCEYPRCVLALYNCSFLLSQFPFFNGRKKLAAVQNVSFLKIMSKFWKLVSVCFSSVVIFNVFKAVYFKHCTLSSSKKKK